MIALFLLPPDPAPDPVVFGPQTPAAPLFWRAQGPQQYPSFPSQRTGKSRCISSNGIYLDANSPASAHVIALAAFLAGRSTDMIGTSAVYKRRKQHPSLQGVFVFTTTEPTLFFWLPSHTFPLADTTEPAPPTNTIHRFCLHDITMMMLELRVLYKG